MDSKLVRDSEREWSVWRTGSLLGTITDEGEWGQDRGRYAAWSPRAPRPRGVVGWYDSPADAQAAIEALAPVPPLPERRTLKGITTPFRLYAVEAGPGGRLYPQGERQGPSGRAYTVERLERRGSARVAVLADGTEILLYGPACKYWVIGGAA